jgi:hypothetical protein
MKFYEIKTGTFFTIKNEGQHGVILKSFDHITKKHVPVYMFGNRFTNSLSEDYLQEADCVVCEKMNIIIDFLENGIK